MLNSAKNHFLLEDQTMYREILDQLEQLLQQEITDFGEDFGRNEEAVWKTILSLGHAALQRIVGRQRNGYHGSHVRCACGGRMKFVEHRSRDIHSLLGWIELTRAYYHCAQCGASCAPYDRRSGLGSQQLSPALAKACCMLAVDDSFEQTSRKIETLFGQQVCDDTIEQVVHQVGGRISAQQEDELKRFFEDKKVPQAQVEPPACLYIAADGTTAHEKDGWHEAKTGCIYWYDDDFNRQNRYLAGFCDSQQFGWMLWLEACKCGLCEAKAVVYLGDGAGWVRSEYERHFSRATFIIDWYHASEHVWGCGKVLFGEGTGTSEDWVKERLSLLWDGWTKRLLDDLGEEGKRYRGRKRQAVEDLRRYISVNEEQMRYDVFRAKGYEIGSGPVEGACKHVVGDRLKRSGMIWSRAGSSSVLALRVAWLNRQWEQVWSQKPLVA